MKWLSASLLIILLSISSLAQHLKLNGKLITDGKRPVPNTRIGIAGRQDGLTDAGGRFSIELSSDLKEGERVIITIGKVRGKVWIINYPLDGEWNLPNIGLQNTQTLDVVIVPRGSKALWTHARIEKEMKGLSDQVTKLQKERDQPKDIDFTEYMLVLATRYGTTPQEARAAFDEWANAEKESTDHHVKGLVDFYNKHFTSAAENFKKAAMKGQENVSEDWKLAGNSALLAYEFRDALASYEHALALTSKAEHPQKWAEVTNVIGIAKQELGIRTDGIESLRMLMESVAAYRLVLQLVQREQLPQEWAATQNNLGIALQAQGSRVEGQEGDELLREAIKAFHQAQLVFTREKWPEDWAASQNNLGIALQEQSSRAEGQQGALLLRGAVEAYRQALMVHTRQRFPEQWAATQVNLGNALQDQSSWTDGQEGTVLLREAVKAYQQALTVYTPDHVPQQWARRRLTLALLCNSKAAGPRGRRAQRY